ncbi:hypothetical protein ACFVT9_33810 [Kitasatospora cineracea]|uniref:hypothetical protein n=1 Tax=Kitasatospora cineracea TaxID=88074 RepID=UPI0036DF0312
MQWVERGSCGNGTAYALAGNPTEELPADGRAHTVQEHPGEEHDGALAVRDETLSPLRPVPAGGERDWPAARTRGVPLRHPSTSSGTRA